MRNLRISRHASPIFTDQLLPLAATAWDTTTDSLICAFGPSNTEAVIELKRLTNSSSDSTQNLTTIATWDAPCPIPDLECDKVISLQYFPDTSSACLVLAGGDIVFVREQPLSGEEAIEIVGSVDAGISAAAWSPDEELLALATNAGTIIYMTREFDPSVNITLTADDIKVSNHVSVGWGKAETQFKGKRAKALRDPTMPEHVDEGSLSAFDDHSTTITWRGDGAYLAVNSVEGDKRRMIRVYSRDGVLDSVSEPVDFLEGALSWRPSGNLIAGIQRRTNRIDVVFFERNGLRHGEFPLRLTVEEQSSIGSNIGLSWNTDSTVLAISLKDRVQFWTMGNYHYYLKQEIRTVAEPKSSKIVNVRWHTEKALRVALHDADRMQDVEFRNAIMSGTKSTPSDYGLVAVIDGSCLKLTPLRLANVPPPISLHEAHTSANVKDVAVAPSGKHLAILDNDEVSTFEYLDSKRPRAPRLLSRRKIKLTQTVPRQIAFRDDHQLFLLADDLDTGASLCWHGESSGDIEDDSLTLLDGSVKELFLSSDLQLPCILSEGGEMTQYEVQSGYLGVKEMVRIPGQVSSAEVTQLKGETVVFGKTPGGNLYANEKLLSRNVTSMLLTTAHLVFTTTQHLLKFIHMTSSFDLDVPADEPELDERCRRIERGARLVTAMPTTYSVVLQMPRGNLETVFPRAMVLNGIRKSIDQIDYRTAFLACRNQRVDMNILYDHDPEQFVSKVSDFIKQLKDAGHLDLFVSQLRNEDVTVSMYRNTSATPEMKTGVNVGAVNGALDSTTGTPTLTEPTNRKNKVNRICDAILKELEKSADDKMQNIITAHVCKSPPDLDAGLIVVSDIQKVDPERAEKAAEHICFLADVNHLYDNSLGLYNLDLALLIAQQSQKDPREYLPYMQGLQELTPLRRSFAIDDKLGRRSKALGHLHELLAFDEFYAYVQKHELYPQALEIVKYQPDKLRVVMKLYADYLNSQSRFKEAAIAYDNLADHASATLAYQSSNLWRECLTSALLVPYSESEVTSLARDLADSLVELKDFSSAATIYLDYLADIPSATRLFCRGTYFSEALRLLTLHKQAAQIPSIIDPALVEASASTTELLADCKSQLAAQIPRLRDLRVKKAADPLAFYGGDPTAGADGPDIPDNVSLAPTDATTSAGTFMTRYTGRTGTVGTATTRRTSKNKRREERKRARGKKGSVYEEEYLVASIERLIERVNSTAAEVERLVSGLVRRDMRERAKAVQDLMTEVLAGCESCVPEVFQIERKAVGPDGEDLGDRPQGPDGVLWDSMAEAKVKKAPPTVKKLEGFSLVG